MRRLLALSFVVAAACGGGKKADESGLVFDPTVLHHVDITVAEADLPQLVNGNKDRIPCTLSFDDVTLTDVGIRLKGGFGSVQDLATGKPGFSVKTNEFVQGQDLHGIKKFTLDNSVQDPSFLSERLGFEIFRRAGVPASRDAYVRLTFNGEYFGVYLVTEALTKDFLEQNFADGSGNLYEGPGDLIDVDTLDIDTNEDVNDRSDLAALREVILNVPDDQIVAQASRLVDMDELLTYWAVEILAYHWDGYAEFGTFGCCSPNNYNVYHEPTLDKFFFMPHGIDQLFQDVSVSALNPPSPGSSLPSRLFAQPEIKQRLAEKIREVAATAWDAGLLDDIADQSVALIRDSVLEFDRNPNFDPAGFDPVVADRKRFLEIRPQIVLDQLSNAGL